MRAREFFEQGQRLAAISNGRPSDYRTAISRAYYAAYHTLRLLLSQAGLHPAMDRDAHRDARLYLEKSGDQALARLAGTIKNLHSRRKDADYKIEMVEIETQQQAVAAVQRAQMIIETLEKNGIPPAAMPALRQWEQNNKPR